MSADSVLSDLVSMSRWLGDPAQECVILGEGNTSARVDDETFFVKASGVTLEGIQPAGFVHVRFEPILAMLEEETLSDAEVKERLQAARVTQGEGPMPSVETTFHAALLQLKGVNFVGHTHPTEVMGLLCSTLSKQLVQLCLFPDQIVCCGVAPVYVPYTDPGLPLAKAIRDGVTAYIEEYGERPKAVMMENHGLIALGATPKEVQSITAMWVKTTRIILRTRVAGGPRPMTPENVARIHTRPDEKYRQDRIEQK